MLKFNLPEKLFILSIDDRTNQITSAAQGTLRLALAGGLLSELALAGKIQLEGKRLSIGNPEPTSDPLFDEVLANIAGEKKALKLKRWVEILNNKHIEKMIAERLAERHVIQVEKKHFLWVIPYEIYPEIDASAKYWIKQQLRGIVLAGMKSEPADIVLLSLLRACRLLGLVFTKDERKQASREVKILVKGEEFGKAVEEALADIEASIATATIVATMN